VNLNSVCQHTSRSQELRLSLFTQQFNIMQTKIISYILNNINVRHTEYFIHSSIDRLLSIANEDFLGSVTSKPCSTMMVNKTTS